MNAVALAIAVLLVMLSIGICASYHRLFRPSEMDGMCHKHRHPSGTRAQASRGCYNIRSDQIGITFTFNFGSPIQTASAYTENGLRILEYEFLSLLKRGCRHQRFKALFEEEAKPRVTFDIEASTALFISTRSTSGVSNLISRAASKNLQEEYVEFLRQKVHRRKIVLSVQKRYVGSLC